MLRPWFFDWLRIYNNAALPFLDFIRVYSRLFAFIRGLI